jgi:pullulanase
MGNAICTFVHSKNANSDNIEVTIPAWKDQPPTKKPVKTITGNVKVIKDFAMPQLNRVTDVSIYFPPSYGLNTEKKYAVLYMLDGQNVFDRSTAHSDEWQVDESLEALIAKGEIDEFIVVAIANGPRRWNEYNPWDYKSWATKAMETGEGDKTIAFIKDDLKPYIDKNYRTQVENTSTGLAGSSLGGLMALYGAMEYSDVFGFVAAFSPSLAIINKAEKNVLFEALKAKKNMGDVKVYVDMGKMEYGTYKEVELLQQHLLESGVPTKNLKLVKDDLGRHCELDWAKRFPDAVTWLFKA